MLTAVTQIYVKGDIAPMSGFYVCIPCGFTQCFEAGARFTECTSCLAGMPLGPEGYRENEQEFWQLDA